MIYKFVNYSVDRDVPEDRPKTMDVTGSNDHRHGTIDGYNYHRCRCPRCRAAVTADTRRRLRAKAAARRAAKLATGPPEPRHGTITGYNSDRCRCEQCRAAIAAYSRRRRAAMSPEQRRAIDQRSRPQIRASADQERTNLWIAQRQQHTTKTATAHHYRWTHCG